MAGSPCRRATVLEGLLLTGLLFALLGLGQVLLGPGAFGVIDPSSGFAQPLEVEVGVGGSAGDSASLPPSQPDGPPGRNYEVRTMTKISVVTSRPDLEQKVTLGGAQALVAGLGVAVLWLLLRMTQSLRDGDPFVRANVRRLQLMAVLVALAGSSAEQVRYLGARALLDQPGLSFFEASHTISFTPLLTGFAIFVAAEIFRRGAALREDTMGLV